MSDKSENEKPQYQAVPLRLESDEPTAADIAHAEASLEEFKASLPERYQLAIIARGNTLISDCMRHGEGGKAVLIYMTLLMNLRILKGEV